MEKAWQGAPMVIITNGKMGRGRFPFYVVRRGRTIGIFGDWDECERSILGFSGAIYRGFFTVLEAERFLNNTDSRIEDGESSVNYYNRHEMVMLAGLCYVSFDGASRGFPRQSGAGCILFNKQGYVVYEIRVGFSDVPTVAAEYLALIYGGWA